MSEAELRRIESPCIGVCIIDEATGLCEGCLRTLDEVAVWGSSSAQQRRAILAAIDRRRARPAIDRPPVSG
jgi:predicted Fe-S protein YdhL (DUF1289 family)